jgi:uncharacterized protein
MKIIFIPLALLTFAKVFAQPPILDMHMHAMSADFAGPMPSAQCVSTAIPRATDKNEVYGATWQRQLSKPPCVNPVWAPRTDAKIMQQTIEAMQKLNILGVVSGNPARVANYMQGAPGRFYPGISFELGVEKKTFSLSRLRELHAQNQLAVFGEIANQYQGILPNDPKMAPYWAMAEELDLPVAIHIGTGPPGATYLGYPNYRAHMHSALTMEEVLIRHPKLRVQIMHAGYPLLDDLLAVLYVHPQVYVDVGVIVWVLPRQEFYRYLNAIVTAGYASRVMFGSDQMIWPGVIEPSVAIINEAPFLDAQQKRDILYNNAARFLRLSEEEIRRHHDLEKD